MFYLTKEDIERHSTVSYTGDGRFRGHQMATVDFKGCHSVNVNDHLLFNDNNNRRNFLRLSLSLKNIFFIEIPLRSNK